MGKIDSTRINFFNPEFRKSWPAMMLVTTRAMLDRIPLHCFATSMLVPGR
jgi:hypothetical protein